MNSHHDGSSSSAADEAIRKAKEIAARLSAQTQVHSFPFGGATISTTAALNVVGNSDGPNEDSNNNSNNILNGSANATSGSHKRKRWGVLPADEEETSEKRPSLTGSTTTTTAAPPAAVEPITKRVWVGGVTEEKPAAHFLAYGKRHIAEIIERLTGEKPTPEEEDSDSEANRDNNKNEAKTKPEDPTKLSISFQGKGADPHKAVLPGVPEEPLHCRIQGPTKLLVEEAASAMEDVLQEAANAPTDTEAVAAHERALVLTQSLSLDQILAQAANRTPGAYRPASVAALIHNNNMALPADKLAAALLHGSAAAVNKEVHVPNGLVGYLIGRGGENIARMQALTGCKVQIQKEHELQPGQTSRIITLSAATEEAVEECERMIQETVQERTNYHQRGGAGVGGGGAFAAAPSAGVAVEMDVPDADIGLIIGKMGGEFSCTFRSCTIFMRVV